MEITAVEWLLNHIDIKFIGNTEKYIQKAKEMEKQQIKEAYLRGIKNYGPTFKSE